MRSEIGQARCLFHVCQNPFQTRSFVRRLALSPIYLRAFAQYRERGREMSELGHRLQMLDEKIAAVREELRLAEIQYKYARVAKLQKELEKYETGRRKILEAQAE